MNDLTRRLAASALAGAATGSRSMTGVGGLVLAARATSSTTQPDRFFAHTPVQVVAAVLAGVEYVGDKLPQAPSRLEPPGAGARAVGALACGVIVARRETGAVVQRGSPSAAATVGCAAAALVAAAATAWGGVRFRAWCARRFGTDWVGALTEDAAALALAGGSITLSS